MIKFWKFQSHTQLQFSKELQFSDFVKHCFSMRISKYQDLLSLAVPKDGVGAPGTVELSLPMAGLALGGLWGPSSPCWILYWSGFPSMCPWNVSSHLRNSWLPHHSSSCCVSWRFTHGFCYIKKKNKTKKPRNQQANKTHPKNPSKTQSQPPHPLQRTQPNKPNQLRPSCSFPSLFWELCNLHLKHSCSSCGFGSFLF